MALLVGEARDLRLDGGTVARSNALDDAVCHRCTVEVRANDLMRRLVCIGEVARRLLIRHCFRQKGKGGGGRVARLHSRLCKVDGAAVNARGRAGLEAHEFQPERAERIRERHRGALSVRAAVIDGLAEDDAPAQIRPRGDDDGVCRDPFARLTEDAGDPLACARFLGEEFRHKQLTHVEIVRILDRFFHDALIEEFVRLHAQRMDGRPLACVEEAPLNARTIRSNAHLAAESVDFADKVTLAGAADGRVAGHHCDVVQ